MIDRISFRLKKDFKIVFEALLFYSNIVSKTSFGVILRTFSLSSKTSVDQVNLPAFSPVKVKYTWGSHR